MPISYRQCSIALTGLPRWVLYGSGSAILRFNRPPVELPFSILSSLKLLLAFNRTKVERLFRFFRTLLFFMSSLNLSVSRLVILFIRLFLPFLDLDCASLASSEFGEVRDVTKFCMKVDRVRHCLKTSKILGLFELNIMTLKNKLTQILRKIHSKPSISY